MHRCWFFVDVIVAFWAFELEDILWLELILTNLIWPRVAVEMTWTKVLPCGPPDGKWCLLCFYCFRCHQSYILSSDWSVNRCQDVNYENEQKTMMFVAWRPQKMEMNFLLFEYQAGKTHTSSEEIAWYLLPTNSFLREEMLAKQHSFQRVGQAQSGLQRGQNAVCR